MKVELRAIDSIKPYPQNPRKNDSAVEAVAKSIKDFGFRQPIVVDADGVIVVGHTRWKAAQSLGMTEVPVHVAKDLTPEKAKAYRLADNRLNEIAVWDDALLPLELGELKDLGVELSDLGWTEAELQALMAPAGTPEMTDADDVPEPPKVAASRVGDLWILGEHRLLCGDSTSEAQVQRVLGGKQAALCATDPPYLVDYTGERPNDSGKDWTDTYKEVEITDADRFFRSVFTNIKSVLAPHAAIYCWHAHKRQRLIADIWNDLQILDHQQIVWVKPTPVFGRVFWHFRHEPCMMGWIQGSMPEHDSNHEFNSVWEIDWEGKSRIVGNEHPTQKPVEIFARPIRKHTQPGDTVFEPFSGSGSQLIAAELTGRRCCAIELEPVFVDVAIRRWQDRTNKQAVLEGTDGTWDEVRRERLRESEAA
jgi:DNA modification methylase